MFDIEKHEKEILAVGYRNKTIENKDKLNQLNLMEIQSLLGTNPRLPLSNVYKRYIWIEQTNQSINEFSIGYMMNPNFHKNKAFREQVKGCLKKIWSIYQYTHR